MANKKNKVYCENCTYVHKSDEWGDYDLWCHKVLYNEDTPIRSKEVYAIPIKHNRHNNCPYYKKMPWIQEFWNAASDPIWFLAIILTAFGIYRLLSMCIEG